MLTSPCQSHRTELKGTAFVLIWRQYNTFSPHCKPGLCKSFGYLSVKRRNHMRVVERTLRGAPISREKLLAQPITGEQVSRIVRRAKARA